MNENKNNSSDRDEEYYRKQRERIRNKKRQQKIQKKLEKIKKRNEKRRLRKEFVSTQVSQVKAYAIHWVHPNTIVSFVIVVVLLRDSNQLRRKIDEQQAYILQIEQAIEVPIKRSYASIGKEYLKENWPKIVIGGGAILVPVAKQIYKSYLTNRKLEKTENVLQETQTKLDESNTRLHQASTNLFEVRTSLDETRTKLEKSEIEKLEAKKKAESDLNKLETKISKLHVTLNRFNDAAMASAKRETQMRAKIQESKQKLADAIEARHTVTAQLEHYKSLFEIKNNKLSENSIKLKTLEANIGEKEVEQAKLLKELEKTKNEKRLFNFKASKLEKQLQTANQERENLSRKISGQEKTISEIKVEKKQLEHGYQSQLENQKSLEKQTELLRKENDQTACLLQEAVDKTNHYALEMDSVKDEMTKLRKDNLGKFEELEFLRQEMVKKQQVISAKTAQIKGITSTNEKLEKSITEIKNQLNQKIIDNESIVSQIMKDKEFLTEAHGKEKNKLLKNIEKQEKALKFSEKEKAKLAKSFDDKDRQLAKQQAKQEGLINEIQKLEVRANEQKSYFGRLQMERQEQEKQFSSALKENTRLVNELLDQQEIDQKRYWFQKIKFHFSPQISVKTPVETQKEYDFKAREKEYYFFTPWSTEESNPFPKIKEKFSEKKKQWELVEPTRNNSIN